MLQRKHMIIFSFLAIGVVACSNQTPEESTTESKAIYETTEESADQANSREMAGEMTGENEMAANDSGSPAEEDDVPVEMTERKIVYHANLHVKTGDFSKTMELIEKETMNRSGYIVTSESHGNESDNNLNGSLTVRIPSEKFQSFLAIYEDGDMEVTERSVRGEDVTEQYVDLNARLNSKKVVEERLLSFMEEAEETEDLLTISADLSAVQEEIETLTGKINYLDNQSSYATIEIYISEKNTELPSVKDESNNTWVETKEQFKKSVQILVSIASGLFIFIVGNAPVIILFVLLTLVIFIAIRRKSSKAKE
ncbi:DUF4349 domain-containing protein [Gracilibacillus xinjiangensis]|uniref:DUF4349 domain-containing protein n=1 Tax=Gracilibacillus xinjiangensis TaxID=1193282 RepID=A0ABV8WUR6_9BACI